MAMSNYFTSQTVEITNYDHYGSPYSARVWRYGDNGRLWIVVRTALDEYPLIIDPAEVMPVTSKRQPKLPRWAR